MGCAVAGKKTGKNGKAPADRGSQLSHRKSRLSDKAETTGRVDESATDTPSRDLPVCQPPGFPVVGIGASAGGLEALCDLLDHLPADTGMAFVVVTHQHPEQVSLLPELLGRETSMIVSEALDGVVLEPDHVYVATPGGHLAIANGVLHRLETGNKEAPRLPIDSFFRSLAEEARERAICIVLSGTGSDGTLGVKAVKGESGMAMVQQPQSAKYAGMPASAIATGVVDYILPPAAMPEQLIAYARGPFLAASEVAAESPEVPAEPMQRIFMLLRRHSGHDFSGYKSNTLRRRIERRMNVHQIGAPDQYVRYLQENPPEIEALFKELLISVTNFFRDPEAWEALASHIDHLIKSRPEHYTLRAWVPGCATGEEVYSLAIVLRECMDRLNRFVDVQIFGTDLDADAIETARAGKYPDGIMVDVSSRRLKRYFIHDDSGYQIRKEIREMVIFAQQNVVKDPPFTRLDVISCRNLLIYLNGDLQKKLLPIFHYALVADGILFLGVSETVGSLTERFQARDKHWKIYRCRENSRMLYTLPQIPAQPMIHGNESTALPAATAPEVAVAAALERLLLKRFAPASVVVNHLGDIVYIHGHTGLYLEPAQGEPSNNILEMAREGLQIELATAMRECETRHQEITRENIPVKTNGDLVHVDLTVTKIHEPASIRGLSLVTFRHRPVPEKGKRRKPAKKSRTNSQVLQLERELRYMRDSHQMTLEQLKTSNEELKSTNEELQSTNEELQSANEELETSREEMQSLNEELTTVNTELQSKVDELSHANDDMQNLLNSTDIATVFLDNDFNIKRFTERAKGLVMLRPADVGRPISELVSNLASEDLAADCREVLRTLVFKEAEVETRDGGSFLMRILPYRTAENVIDGVVVTFVDINRLKAGETARAYFESIVDTLREPLVVLDESLQVKSANHAFYRRFHCGVGETGGKSIFEIKAGLLDSTKLRKLLLEILPKQEKFEDFTMDVNSSELGRRTFVLNARRLEQDRKLPGRILLVFEEITHKAELTKDAE